jgi:hypothetical protein
MNMAEISFKPVKGHDMFVSNKMKLYMFAWVYMITNEENQKKLGETCNPL